MHIMKMGFEFVGGEERLEELRRELMDSVKDLLTLKWVTLVMSETQIEDIGDIGKVVPGSRSQAMTDFPEECPCGLDEICAE